MSKVFRISNVEKEINEGEFDEIIGFFYLRKMITNWVIEEIEKAKCFMMFLPDKFENEYLEDEFRNTMNMLKASGEPVENYFDSEEEYDRLYWEFRNKWSEVCKNSLPVLVREKHSARAYYYSFIKDMKTKHGNEFEILERGNPRFSWYKKGQ